MKIVFPTKVQLAEDKDMNEAPEGLSYDTDNYKYAKADKKEADLEKGKFESAMRSLPNHAEHMAAEAVRMKDGGCCDPIYGKK